MSPINPIIPYLQLQDQPPNEFHKKKLLLNEEFKTKAKIQGLVSYIYYPSGTIVVGHAELELEGTSWTLLGKNAYAKPLSRMISASRSGYGLPFFRFNISVTPNQLHELEVKSMSVPGLTCSIGAFLALALYGKYKIPFPIAISPLATSLYLTAAQKSGSRRIGKIEFYGGDSHMRNFIKCIPGLAGESFKIKLTTTNCFSLIMENIYFIASCAGGSYMLKKLKKI